MKYLTRQSPGVQWGSFGGHGFYYHETNSSIAGDIWKLDVGAECNRLLAVADEIGIVSDEGNLVSKQNDQLSKDIRSIVRRVAEFESLQEEP